MPKEPVSTAKNGPAGSRGRPDDPNQTRPFAAQPPERPLVQIGLDLRAGPTDQQPQRSAEVAQGQWHSPLRRRGRWSGHRPTPAPFSIV